MATNDVFSKRVGTGGSNTSFIVVTHGKERFEFSKDQPALTGAAVTAAPVAPVGAGVGTWFFRDAGDGKSQFCVRFPSGAVQVLATEP